MKQYYVYILANKTNSTLYVGVTSDLLGRVYQHKEKMAQEFTSRYNINWKARLISKENPQWKDLYDDLL